MSKALDDAILEGLEEMESYDMAVQESELIDIVSGDIDNEEADAELIDNIMDSD